MRVISNILNRQIQTNNQLINKYYADIDAYQNGINEANYALNRFNEVDSEMRGLIDEIQIVFKGEAAVAFNFRLVCYLNSIQFMIPVLDQRIREFQSRIAKFEGLINSCNKANQNLEKWSRLLRTIGW